MRNGWVRRAPRADRVLVVAFALACLWCANAFFGPNTMARVAVTHALVTRGGLDIDEVAAQTVDKARWHGHYYCDKAPGISLFCTPAVFVAERAADALGRPPGLLTAEGRTTFRYVLDCFACLLSTTIALGAATLVVFRRVLVRLGVASGRAALIALALGFGTPVFTWSTVPVGHATAAALLFMTFATAWWPGPRETVRWLAAGALLGAAVLVEFTAAPAGGLIALFLLLRERAPIVPTLHRALLVAAGGLPFALALGWYGWAAFGSPLHLGYASTEGWEGMKTGFFGISAPSLEALWGITFGAYRGLAWLAPAALLGFPAALLLLADRTVRAPALAAVSVAACYLLINAGYYYWDGGSSLGPRHLTPALPFLLFALALWMERQATWARAAIGLLLAAGVLIEVVATSVMIELPHDGSAMLAHNILPALLAGHSELMLAKLHLPFALLVGVPLLIVSAGAALLARGPAADGARLPGSS